MKRKIFHIGIVSAMLVTFACNTVTANPPNITITECDDVNRLVTISGNIDTTRQNENIVLTVLKKDVTKTEYESVDPVNINNVLSYLLSKPLEADGSFSFTFKLTGETGNYTVLLDSKALDSTYSEVLDFTNTLWDELKALKDDTSDGATDRFRSFVETEAFSLGVDLTEYNEISDKNAACAELKSFAEDYTSITFPEQWDKNVLWSFINESRANLSAVSSMVDSKNAGGNVNFSHELITFAADELSDTQKMALYTNVLDNPYCNSLDTFVQLVKDNLCIVYIKSTDYWKDAYNLIEEENNIFGFNSSSLATFGTLNDKDGVVNQLHTQGKSKNTSAEIISLFDTLVSAQKAAGTQPAPTQKPRPGGGGGGGSWSVGIPATTPIPTPTVTPEPTEPAEPQTPAEPVFNDIESVEWAKEAIEYLAEKEILSGVGAGRFEPNRYMTREELVKMLDNFFGYSKDETDSDFADADKDAWYYGAISGAANKGVVTGYEDNTFGIGKNITREDAAVILLRAFGSDSFGEAAEPEFSDNDNISDYAKEAVGILSNSGIISGMGDGSFMPKGNLTRAQAAKMFYGLLQYVEA
ncbi:MAG: S-layer homology domain-containing protein [Clostridia bacterium]|nr:S-layer homology domain-containing protein [Clostridia bacterium]